MLSKLLTPTFLSLIAIASAAFADATLQEMQAQTPALIEQLGSDRYAERRAAQHALADIGLAAFDQLLAAREHEDLEIATAATRLLSQMTIRWTQPGDSAAVRNRLDAFGRLSDQERAEVVGELASLPDGQAAPALCRIARFDLADSVASRAVVALMEVAAEQENERGRATAALTAAPEMMALLSASVGEIDQRYGVSGRRTTRWLRWFLNQELQPADAARRWQEELDRLRVEQQRDAQAIDAVVLNGLAWNLLRVELQAGQHDAASHTALALVKASPNVTSAVLRRAINWMLTAGANTAVDRLLATPTDIDYLKTKGGLYLVAKTRLKQNRQDEAQQAAALAFDAEPGVRDVISDRRGRQVVAGRVAVGVQLRAENHPDWAARELRSAIQDEGPLSANGAYATWSLADLLQDEAQYAEASQLLATFLAAVNADEESQATYLKLVESRQDFFLPLNVLAASEALYRAQAARDSNDPVGEQAALREAIEHDSTNADIVIAMYRAAPPEFPLRRDAKQRIRAMANRFEEQIDQNPGLPIPLNQWAWLIANTEGDSARAVRYSLRSLDLSPDNAGYLDTLGRCYYATGELEKAAETQRRAVKLQPHYKVMQRQLQFFEQELANKNPPSLDGEGPGEG